MLHRCVRYKHLMSTKARSRRGATILLLYASTLPFSNDLVAAEADLEAQSLTAYQEPKVLKAQAPVYPFEMQTAAEEGWVLLRYMVDTNGKPYEISVVDSVGNLKFSQAAIAALKEFSIQPAMLDGQPIDAEQQQKVVFQLEGGEQGAKRRFVGNYKRISKAILASDKEHSDQLFEKLTVTNLYEDAYYNFLRSLYYAQWGTPSEQLAAVRRAVAYEQLDTYLPRPLYLKALRIRFALEAKLQDYAAAESTATLLLPLEQDESQLAKLRQAVGQLAELRDSSQTYSVDGDLGDRTSYWLNLFRNRFQVSVTEGRVAELKLRCRTGYVLFRYDPELQYSVPPDHMPCGLEILGDPGTRFSIVQ